MAMHSQRPNPDIRLNVLDHMADVDLTVRVRQRGRDEDLAAAAFIG